MPGGGFAGTQPALDVNNEHWAARHGALSFNEMLESLSSGEGTQHGPSRVPSRVPSLTRGTVGPEPGLRSERHTVQFRGAGLCLFIAALSGALFMLF